MKKVISLFLSAMMILTATLELMITVMNMITII